MKLIFNGIVAMELQALYYPERKAEESEVFIQVPKEWLGKKIICLLEKEENE